MALIRIAARPLMAGVFILEGADTLRDPKPAAEKAAPVIEKLQDAVPALPSEPTAVVRLNAAVQVLAAAALATGKLPRLAALVLAGSLGPTTIAGHRWWEYDDPSERAANRRHFAKNAAILGGLLFAIADRGGKPSVGWRARRAKSNARKAAKASKAARKAKQVVPGL